MNIRREAIGRFVSSTGRVISAETDWAAHVAERSFYTMKVGLAIVLGDASPEQVRIHRDRVPAIQEIYQAIETGREAQMRRAVRTLVQVPDIERTNEITIAANDATFAVDQFRLHRRRTVAWRLWKRSLSGLLQR